LKISYVCEQFKGWRYGGSETSLTILADYMRKKGHHIHFIVGKTTNLEMSSKVRYACSKNKYLELFCSATLGYDPIALNSSLKVFKKIRPDVIDVYSNSYQLSLAPIFAAKKLGIPVLVTIRDYSWICPYGNLLKLCEQNCSETSWENCINCIHNDQRSFKRFLSKIVPRQTSELIKRAMYNTLKVLRGEIIVANSRYVKNVLTRFGFDKNKIVVIPPPIDLNEFQPPFSYEKNVLWVGSFIKEKGPKYFIKIANYFKNELGYPDINFIMIGGGPLIGDYSKEKNVKILGKLPYKDVINYYKNAYAIVVTSIWPEPFGRVAPEAMACEKPVLAFASGGLTESIIDGKNGFITPPKDYTMLSKKLALLFDNRKLAFEMGLNGRKNVAEKYSLEVVGRQYESLYYKMTQKP